MILQARSEQQVQQAVQQQQAQANPAWMPIQNAELQSAEPGTQWIGIEGETAANGIMAGNDIVQNINQNVSQEAWLQMEGNLLNQAIM
jgi:hypothetical protein